MVIRISRIKCFDYKEDDIKLLKSIAKREGVNFDVVGNILNERILKIKKMVIK